MRLRKPLFLLALLFISAGWAKMHASGLPGDVKKVVERAAKIYCEITELQNTIADLADEADELDPDDKKDRKKYAEIQLKMVDLEKKKLDLQLENQEVVNKLLNKYYLDQDEWEDIMRDAEDDYEEIIERCSD